MADKVVSYLKFADSEDRYELADNYARTTIQNINTTINNKADADDLDTLTDTINEKIGIEEAEEYFSDIDENIENVKTRITDLENAMPNKASAIKVNELSQKMDLLFGESSEETASGNLYDSSESTVGKYLALSNGTTVERTNEKYFYTGYIPTNGTNLLYFVNVAGTSAVFCYNSNKVLITDGVSRSLDYYQSAGDFPSGTAYIRFNSGVAKLSIIEVYYSEADYKAAHGGSIPVKTGSILDRVDWLENEVSATPIIINVGANETVTDLWTAVKNAEAIASKKTPVTIHLKAGNFDVLPVSVLVSATSAFYGLTLPDYTHIEGEGVDKTFIIGRLPIDISSYSFARNNVSVLNLFKNNNLKNLTVIGKNLRYCIHDDDHYGNATVVPQANEVFENVNFVIELADSAVTGVSQIPVGVGISNGRTMTYKNCRFVSVVQNDTGSNYAVLLHNNVNNTSSNIPCEIVFNTCYFGEGLRGSLGLSSVGSGQTEIVILEGCILEDNIRIYKQTAYTGTTSEFVIKGHSNAIPGYEWVDVTQDDSLIQIVEPINDANLLRIATAILDILPDAESMTF